MTVRVQHLGRLYLHRPGEALKHLQVSPCLSSLSDTSRVSVFVRLCIINLEMSQKNRTHERYTYVPNDT